MSCIKFFINKVHYLSFHTVRLEEHCLLVTTSGERHYTKSETVANTVAQRHKVSVISQPDKVHKDDGYQSDKNKL